MKAVFLDYEFIDIGDLDLEGLRKICDFELFKSSTREESMERCGNAQIVVTDSCKIDALFMDRCPNLKYVGVAATGYDNVDIAAARERGIAVTNVPAYSSEAVAQHTIALLLHLTNKVGRYERGQKPEKLKEFIPELLAGKSLGIVGYGGIGRIVGEIGRALGMTVNIYSRNPVEAQRSDVVSLHCPLNENTKGMIDGEFIEGMKDGAILINTARGGLVDEEALATALKSGKLAGAGLDVTAQEPPEEDCPLLGLDNCCITPHIAFMPRETRQKVMDIACANIRAFMEGGEKNRIV